MFHTYDKISKNINIYKFFVNKYKISYTASSIIYTSLKYWYNRKLRFGSGSELTSLVRLELLQKVQQKSPHFFRDPYKHIRKRIINAFVYRIQYLIQLMTLTCQPQTEQKKSKQPSLSYIIK